MTTEDLQQIQTLVTSAHRVLVLTRKNPSVDAMACALSIYLAMIKLGKDVTVAMESPALVEVANLVGIDQVKTSLSGKNLTLTYKPYALGDFEKVSYLEDQGQAGTLSESFKLTITPRDGLVPDPKNFTFSSSGASADLIYTVDVLEPTQLGTLYDPSLFSTVPIVNIDNHDPNKDYGRFNLVEPEAASISEIVTFFLRAVNVQLDADIAGNLYQGIISASNKFQSPKVAAATFEAAAICLRSGVKPNVNPVNNASPRPQQQIVSPTQPPKPQRNSTVPQDWNQPKAYRGTSTS